MAGLTDKLGAIIHDLRVDEIASAASYRFTVVYAISIGTNLPEFNEKSRY